MKSYIKKMFVAVVLILLIFISVIVYTKVQKQNLYSENFHEIKQKDLTLEDKWKIMNSDPDNSLKIFKKDGYEQGVNCILACDEVRQVINSDLKTMDGQKVFFTIQYNTGDDKLYFGVENEEDYIVYRVKGNKINYDQDESSVRVSSEESEKIENYFIDLVNKFFQEYVQLIYDCDYSENC